MISFAAMMLLFKKLTATTMLPEVINFYFFLFSTIAILIFNLLRGTKLELPSNSIYIFVLAALIAVVANYFSISAIKSAPNPGYSRAIQGFDVVIITISSVFLFGAQITIVKAAGIALSICGLILLSL
jgi:drug/metabolite transporter (DMT)-like permease